MPATRIRTDFVLCIANNGVAASLDVGKVYRRLPDSKGSRHGMLRIVDESGDDYLFPRDFFVPVKLPVLAGNGDPPQSTLFGTVEVCGDIVGPVWGP